MLPSLFSLSSLSGFFIILLMDKHTDFAGGFLESVGRPLMTGVSLKEQSSFRIGGKAEFFFKAGSAEELKAAVTRARLGSVPFYIIGGGYNILFPDEGYRGLIIRNEAQGIVLGPGPGEIEILSGTPLSKVLQYALDNGLAGLEFLAGIPGTLGGALYSNAGAFGSSIGDIFREGVFLDEKGNERMAERNDLAFAYRRSALQRKHSIVLSAVLKAAAGDPEIIRNGIKENLDKRRRKQPPWGTSCAGSYFKNPVLPDGTKVAAGRLLEEAGARDVRVGDAAVFSGHCNFLINLGRARARDILALAAELKERVRAKSGILLEEEVIYLPGSFSMS
jgi:UDP-N-acetylmuramate dehydrogenase